VTNLSASELVIESEKLIERSKIHLAKLRASHLRWHQVIAEFRQAIERAVETVRR
jgi:hypothetical protein